MSIEELLWVAIPATSAILYTLLFLTRRQDLGDVQRWFAAFLAAGIVWSVGSMLLHANPGFIAPIWWVRLSAFGTISMQWLMFGFVVRFLSIRDVRLLSGWNLAAYMVIQLLNMTDAVVYSTTVEHGLVANRYSWGTSVVAVFWFLYFLLSVFLLARELRRTKDTAFRQRVSYLLIVMALLLAGNITNATPLTVYPIDILLAGVAATLISLSVSRYQILEAQYSMRRLGIIGVALTLYIVIGVVIVYALAQLDREVLLPVTIFTAFASALGLIAYPPTRRSLMSFVDRMNLPAQYNINALIFGISKASNRLRTPSELGMDILEQIVRELGVERAELLMRHESEPIYARVASLGMAPEAQGITFRADSPLIFELTRYRLALHIERLVDLPRLRALWVEEWKALDLLQMTVIAPILIEEELIGFFVLGPKTRSDPFTHQELHQTLPLLANQVSIALANSRLYLREQSRANMLAQANDELHHAEEALRRITDNMQDVILQIDLAGIITYASPSHHWVLGLDPESLIGQPIYTQLHPDDLSKVINTFSQSIGEPTPPPPVIAARTRHADGTYRWMEIAGNLIYDSQGQPLSILLSSRDITARKRIEQELREAHEELEQRVQTRTGELAHANEELQAEITERQRAETQLQRYTAELERSNRELQQFAYVASHDLQEPLRTVTSYMQLLQRRYRKQLDNDADEFINYAVDGALRMRELIQGLLDYSRVSTHGKPFEPVDIRAVLDRALANLKAALDESGTEIHLGTLPVVTGDGTQMMQLFQNLIGNAIKFRRAEEPRVEVGAKQCDGRWEFWVRDNGIGIEPQYHERIFVIFQRLHTRDCYPGTGIGLAVCKRIVERHGGCIWVESAPGRGSTFHFTIAMHSAP
jgi:PAS domain S-box-containing protein